MLIEVTQDDIKHGTRCNAYTCPIANAIHRNTGKCPIVGKHSLRFMEDVDKLIYLPAIVSIAIRKFDDCKEMEPFSFELDI